MRMRASDDRSRGAGGGTAIEMAYDDDDIDSVEEGDPFTPTQFPSTSFDGSSTSFPSRSLFSFSRRSSKKILLVLLAIVVIVIIMVAGPRVIFSSNEDNELLTQNEATPISDPSSSSSPDAVSPSSSSDLSSVPSAAVVEPTGGEVDTSVLPSTSVANGRRKKIEFKETMYTDMDSRLRGFVNSTLRPLRIGSIGLGHWGGTFLDILFTLAFPERAFLYTQEAPTDVVVATHFYAWEPPLPQFEKVPYFSWSGESRLDSLVYYNRPPMFYLLSMLLPKDAKRMEQFATSNEYLVPFVTHVTSNETFHIDPVLLNRSVALGDQPRPYRLVYINSNCEAHRERMFALMLEKCGTVLPKSASVLKKKTTGKTSSHKLCHALGRCSNNFLMASKTAERSANQSDAAKFHEKIVRKFDPDRAHFSANIALFKSYRFALVFEHDNIPGYMTEKIIMAFKGGAIPIFWGSGSNPSYAKQWFNPLAFVDCGDFDTLKQCRDRVYEIDNDPKLLSEMQQQPVFKDNVPTDLFKGIDSQFLKEIAMDLRKGVNIQD